MTRARVVLVALVLAGCGGGSSFRLTSNDNDPARLRAALARAAAPRRGPINATGKPLVFLVARGKRAQLIAFDLAGERELWRVEGDVRSKLAVGGRFVAYLEGERTLVGRDVATGKELWRRPMGGTRFVGGAADRDRFYYTAEDRSAGATTWTLHGLDGRSGDELWRAAAPGALGAPAARGGLVFSPFLKQWLAILDGETGAQLTRVRGLDEAITFVRATPEAVYFGSSAGVFRLDERAASGKRAGSAYARATLPAELDRVAYGWDAFDPVQAGYSAYDRKRLLWRGAAAGPDLRFADDRVVLAIYRFFFGFRASTGALDWAYSMPRVDVVGSAHLGPSIAFASMLGELGALDPATGRRTYRAKVDGQLVGATFDADGFAPTGAVAGDATTTAATLAAIARDRDARFEEVKKFAIAALAAREDDRSTRDLIALVTDERTPPALIDSAAESLAARRDPAGLPDLVAALAIPFDHLTGLRPRGVGALARAIAALGERALEPAARQRAIDALVAKLTAPELPDDDRIEVVRALGAIGGGAEVGPLTRFVLMYRADPAVARQPGAVGAALEVLVDRGMMAREVVAFVAADPRSVAAVAARADALLQPTTRAPQN